MGFQRCFIVVSPLRSPILTLNSVVKYFHWLFTSFFIGFSPVHRLEIPIPSYTFPLSSFLCSLLPSPPHSKRQIESFTDMQKKEGEEHHACANRNVTCLSVLEWHILVGLKVRLVQRKWDTAIRSFSYYILVRLVWWSGKFIIRRVLVWLISCKTVLKSFTIRINILLGPNTFE